MIQGFSEDHVEHAGIETLKSLGWSYFHGGVISPDGAAPQRSFYAEAILPPRLEASVAQINPDIPEEARAAAIRQVLTDATPNLVEENRRLHRLITEGVDVDYKAKGRIVGGKVWLIDFANPQANDWLAVNQFTMIERRKNRRADIVLFVNGLPLAVMELKNPGDEKATLGAAIRQIETYKTEIPSLFRANAALVVSDGIKARIGSLTADEERYMPWRTVNGEDYAPPGRPELDTLLRGVFERGKFLKLIRDFIVFGDKGEGPFKIIAGYHQFHARAESGAAARSRRAPGGGPEDRRDLAHPGLRQELSDGVLRRPSSSTRRIGEPDAGRPDRPQRSRRPTLRHIQHVQDLLRQTPQQAESREAFARPARPPLRRA